jgi:hypothetical protein
VERREERFASSLPRLVLVTGFLVSLTLFNLVNACRIDGEQTHSTAVIKKTLNPYWNETFNFVANPSSVLTIQLFDQKKWKKDANQGFMGVVNIPLAPLLNGDGTMIDHD